MINIYFSGSVRGGRSDQSYYHKIIAYLSTKGNVLTEHLGHPSLSEDEPYEQDEHIFKQDFLWLNQADCLVAEVTTPSTGVGYEIGYAHAQRKPILCLYRTNGTKKISAMINGNPFIITRTYSTLEEAQQHIDRFFQEISLSSTKFS